MNTVLHGSVAICVAKTFFPIVVVVGVGAIVDIADPVGIVAVAATMFLTIACVTGFVPVASFVFRYSFAA